MARIAKETEKLLCYCQATGAERLTDEIVDELVYPDSEYKIYELANALSRKNYSMFMKIVKELSARGFNELSLLNSLCSYFKGLYETSLCVGSDQEVATALGIKEYEAKKNREQAAKFTKEGLFDCYQTIYSAISKSKCGEYTPPSALQAVIAKLFFGNLKKEG
jgi:DNA polymerase III delta subunit